MPLSPAQLTAAARFILEREARRDSLGRLRVYALPANDGGGTFEVAGVNDRYHHDQAWKLRRLIESGQHAAAESEAVRYLAESTSGIEEDVEKLGALSGVASEAPPPAVIVFLRDSAHHRGRTGARKILQRALGVMPDGEFGSITAAAFLHASRDVPALLRALRAACETHELAVAGMRRNFWKGFQRRWDARLEFSLTFL